MENHTQVSITDHKDDDVHDVNDDVNDDLDNDDDDDHRRMVQTTD